MASIIYVALFAIVLLLVQSKPNLAEERRDRAQEPGSRALYLVKTARHRRAANSTRANSTTPAPTTTKSTTPKSKDELENPCTPSALAAGKYFHPHPDSKKYIHCDQSGNYNVQKCGPGTVWIQWQLACNFPIFKNLN